jgi:hypothetical protein
MQLQDTAQTLAASSSTHLLGVDEEIAAWALCRRQAQCLCSCLLHQLAVARRNHVGAILHVAPVELAVGPQADAWVHAVLDTQQVARVALLALLPLHQALHQRDAVPAAQGELAKDRRWQLLGVAHLWRHRMPRLEIAYVLLATVQQERQQVHRQARPPTMTSCSRRGQPPSTMEASASTSWAASSMMA